MALRSATARAVGQESAEPKLCAAYCGGIREGSDEGRVRRGLAGRGTRPRLSACLPHSTLTYVSPMQHEQNWLANQPRQAAS